jgi:steroid delta-isomerase-like uncharacterized protein
MSATYLERAGRASEFVRCGTQAALRLTGGRGSVGPTDSEEGIDVADKIGVVRTAVDAWNAHDRDRYVTGYEPDVTLHGFPAGVDDAATLGDFFAGFWTAVPDARLELGDAFEAGDRVAARLTITGTHEGELMGVPASHRPISVELITILRFSDQGRIAERWNVADFLSMLQQIGAIPTAA